MQPPVHAVVAVLSSQRRGVQTESGQLDRHAAVDLHLRQMRSPAHELSKARRHIRQRLVLVPEEAIEDVVFAALRIASA